MASTTARAPSTRGRAATSAVGRAGREDHARDPCREAPGPRWLTPSIVDRCEPCLMPPSATSRIDTTCASPVFCGFSVTALRASLRTPSGARRARPGSRRRAGRVERREDFRQVPFRRAADALERRAAGRGHLDHRDPAVAFRRRAAHPAALRHRADRVGHGRQADALQRCEVGQLARPHGQHRQQAEMRRRGHARRPRGARRRRCASRAG